MAPTIGSFLLGTRHGVRLRSWYQDVFDGVEAEHSMLRFGDVLLAIDERPDLRFTSAEPTRLTIAFCVPNLAATADRLDALGVRWFGQHTVADPDGNLVHLHESPPRAAPTTSEPGDGCLTPQVAVTIDTGTEMTATQASCPNTPSP